jgi:hypothetical protein
MTNPITGMKPTTSGRVCLFSHEKVIGFAAENEATIFRGENLIWI